MDASLWQWAHPLALNAVVQLIFGGYGTFTASALQSSTISPLVFALYRDVAAAIILLSLAFLTESGKPLPRRRFWPDPPDYPLFTFMGLTGVYGLQGMSAMAVSMVPTVFYSLCTPLQPVAALLCALFAGEETFTASRTTAWVKVGGIATTVLGAVAMVALGDKAQGGGGGAGIVASSKNFPAGCVFITLQVLSAGAYSVYQKPLLARYPPLVAAAWGYVAGVCLLLLSVIPCTTETGAWAVPNTTVLAAIAYACLGCSVFNYVAMAYINKVTSPVLLTAFNPLQGLFGALLAATFLGERVGLPHVVGGLLMGAGLVMTVAAKVAEQRAAAEAAAAGEKAPRSAVGGAGEGGAGGEGEREEAALIGGERGAVAVDSPGRDGAASEWSQEDWAEDGEAEHP